MNKEEFERNKKQIKETLEHALKSPHSAFYRKKYAGLGISAEKINTYEDFLHIPFLTKEELLATPIKERTFVPEDEIVNYSVSSGTTNINTPLITPKVLEQQFQYSENNVFQRIGVRKMMLLLPLSLGTTKARDLRIPVVMGDPQKMEIAAKIAKSLGIDSLNTTPTLLYMFTGYLEKESFDFAKIKLINVGAEFCTEQKANYFRKMYPNAVLRFSYGSSEIARSFGYQCENLQTVSPNVFHLRESVFVEIDGVKTDGVETGELICTHLTKTAFPLIRYRSRDFGERWGSSCECGQEYNVSLKGKIDFDVIRLSGALIHTQIVSNAITAASRSEEPVFRMHVYEVETAGKLYAKLILELVAADSLTEDETEIGQVIQDNLFLSADKTLSDFVEKGLFLPLEIKFVKDFPTEGKSKNLISHLK